MYNTNVPSKMEVPSTAKLLKSTALAAATAGVILVTVVMPAEYGIDPTGAGQMLGLTEMGKIKVALAKEAASDERGIPFPVDSVEVAIHPTAVAANEPVTMAEIEPQASGQPVAPVVEETKAAVGTWKDTTTVELQPGEGAEVKLAMKKGAVATYEWEAAGPVNADLHGDGNGNISYQKDRGLSKNAGELTAAFDGNHGWFWRNRGEKPVTLTLRTNGDYASVKRVK